MLLEHVKDLTRAAEFATKVDEAPVWSELGHAQLAAGHVADAIASYLKAGDSIHPSAAIMAWPFFAGLWAIQQQADDPR